MDWISKIPGIETSFTTIDSHTMGEPTRIVVEGFPELEGKTMIEKKKFLEKNYDKYRTALMLEPRGHRDMFGAVITKPVHPEADYGVIFMDSGGCLNMCGHGSIGTATVLVETGMVEVKKPYTEVTLEAPAGLIRTSIKVENGKAVEVTIRNVPAFLYKEAVTAEIEGYGPITFDISFGGSFFALVNADKLGLDIVPENLREFQDLGMALLNKINATMEIQHPELDINSVDLVEFYGDSSQEEANLKNVVIFGAAQADRSPCGTGTSAKVAALYSKGRLGLNEDFIYESITGSLFRGKAVETTKVGPYDAIVPKITGSAYITGINQVIIDKDDPLKYGFLMGD